MAMSPGRAFQAAVVNALRTDPDVASYVGGRVYDAPPSQCEYPFISIGPEDAGNADADCNSADNRTLQIDVWSSDQARLGPCKDIVFAVDKALRGTILSLADPYSASAVVVRLTQVFLDMDGVTAHGVVQIGARVENG